MVIENNSNKHSIQFGKHKINFYLQKSKRKTLTIKVKPNLTILVKAPNEAKLKQIKIKVHKKGDWIIKQINFFQDFSPITPKKYISGESFKYLGKQYRLKVHQSNLEKVKLKNGYINIYTKLKNDKEQIKSQLDLWYFNLALKRIEPRLKELYPKVKKYNAKPYTFKLRNMKTRWGSCTSKGKIFINPGLIKAPSLCIDYVLIHELCHLVYPNHSKKFYNLLEKIEPNWIEIKNNLERN